MKTKSIKLFTGAAVVFLTACATKHISEARHEEHAARKTASSDEFSNPPPSTISRDDASAVTDKIINQIVDAFQPDAKKLGAELYSTIVPDLAGGAAGGAMENEGKLMHLVATTGMAIAPFMTPDVLAFTMCHELGHAMGGAVYFESADPKHPITIQRGSEPSTEGEADYFAAKVCLRRIWKSETQENARQASFPDPTAQAACQAAWKKPSDRNLCLRILAASLGFARRSAWIQVTTFKKNYAMPSFNTPDTNQVAETIFNLHPTPQCRLDTTLNAARCAKTVTPWPMPGRYLYEKRNGLEAERAMRATSCFDDTPGETLGARPRCWFKARSSRSK